MTPATFNRLGPKLLGDGWKTRLARETKRSVSSVKNWSRGTHPIPAEIAKKITAWLNGEASIRTPACKRGGWKPRRKA
jgi:hypothetical protein